MILFVLKSANTLTVPVDLLHRYIFVDQGPVVQNLVSLTMSLRHKFVKQISAKVTNTLLFFVEKMLEGFSHFFNKKITAKR